MFLVATYASPPNFTVYLFQIWVPEICPSSIILLILMRKRRRPPRPHRTSSLLDIASGLEGSAVSHTLPAMVEMLPIPPPPKKLPQMIRAISVSLGHNTFQNPLAVLYQFDGSHLQEISRTEVAYESTSSVAFISLLLIPLHLACAVLKIGFYNIKEEESNLQGKEISLVDVRLELLQHNKAPPQLGAVGDSTRFCLHCCGEFQVEARSLEKGSTIRAYHFCPEVVVVEELFESPIAFQLPQQILSYLMPARQRDLPAFCQELSRGKLSTVGNDRSSVSNLVQSIEQIKQYEAMITQFGETRISIIPWQVAQHACEVDKQCATSSNKLDPLATYSTVTFGAPTAQHVTKSPHHIGVLQLSAMHDRLSAEILPPTTPDIVAKQHLTQLMSVRASLHERSDVTLCHAACALAESFLAEAQRHILEYNIDEFVAQVCTLGFLFQCESLLSTSGSEAVMLSDYAGVINILRKFAIKVNCLSPTSAYDTQGSLLFIKPSDDNSWTLTIQLPISSSVIPNSFTCKVRAVLFTQGINEQQTVANAIGDTELQEIINRDAVDYISLYVSDFLSWQKGRPLTSPSSPISLPVPNFPPSAPELGYPKPKSPSSKPGSTSTSPISPTTPTMTAATTTTTTTTSALGSSRRSDTRPDDLGGLMEELRELVTTSRREKNVRILTTAADVTRLLNGGRAVSCKSAKDRTSMSVTLEQARILYRLHRVLETDDSVLLAANLMRHSGVRRENAFKNILKDKYAFNALQRRLLPQDYRPPVGTRAGLKAPQS
ncbi:Type II inositol 3 [Pelomyxa schiedti]|nr:Type II inositol 3 [Pelomyxa schiedti]